MKILAATPRLPTPLDKGDRLRARHQLRLLARDHDVTLFSLAVDRRPDAELRELLSDCCDQLVVHRETAAQRWARTLSALLLARRPLQSAHFVGQSARRRFGQLFLQVQPDRVFLQLSRTVDLLPPNEASPGTVAIDLMDAFSAACRERSVHASGLEALAYRHEAMRMRRRECAVLASGARVAVISERDRLLLPDQPERSRVHVVPNGVDLELFRCGPRPVSQRGARLLFVGNMGYRPNILAVERLVRDVLPRVRRRRPEVRLTIAGASPARAVRRLAAQPGVEVTGWADDIRAYYDTSRLLLAPMELGVGVQNKVLQAIVCGVPALVSPRVAQGLPAEAPIGVVEVDAMADAVVAELGRPREEVDNWSHHCRDFGQRHLSWETVRPALDRFLGLESQRPELT